jgi:hypothetical protein
MKLYYTMSDSGEVTLGKIVETHVVYEDLEDTAQTGTDFTSSHEFTDSEEGDFAVNETTATTEQTTPTEGAPVASTENEPITNEFTNDSTEPTPSVENSGAEVAINNPEVSAASEEPIQQESTSSASFTQSERAEFEALQREKKIALLNSFALTDEVRDSLMQQIDSLTCEQLELDLLRRYKAQADAEENFSTAPVPFAVPEPKKKVTAQESLNAYIHKMLGK